IDRGSGEQARRERGCVSRRMATVLRWRLELVGSPRLRRGWQALPKRAVHQRVNLQAGVAAGESAAGRRCVRERQYRANKGPLSRPRRLVDRRERYIDRSVAGCPGHRRFSGGKKLLELSINEVRRLATASGREARPAGRTQSGNLALKVRALDGIAVFAVNEAWPDVHENGSRPLDPVSN